MLHGWPHGWPRFGPHDGRYVDYEQDARRALRAVGEQIRSNGLPAAFSPLVICVAGTGNVSRGAIDAIKALGDDVIEWVMT